MSDVLLLPDRRGRHGNHAKGAKCRRWNQGRMIGSQGYVKLRLGRGHPLADANGYAREHIVVLAAAGVTLGPDEVVHHRNGDRCDNRIENLEVTTRTEHGRIHLATRPRDDLGRLMPNTEER